MMLLKTTLFEMAFIILSEDHLLDFYHRIEGSNSCQGRGWANIEKTDTSYDTKSIIEGQKQFYVISYRIECFQQGMV